MDTANIIYVRALRENGQKDKPDSRIKQAVENINETYKRVGVPYKLNLYDIESFLNKLNKKGLDEIAGTNGKKSELIEKIQEQIPFEEARRRGGVILKNEEWYYKDKKLEPLKLKDITIDYENFRFTKKFDFHQNPEKYSTSGWNLYCVVNKKDKNNITAKLEYNKKRFSEYYTPRLKNMVKELFEGRTISSCNTNELENIINIFLTKEYENGKIESFNKHKETYFPYIPPYFLTIDYCTIYINSINDRKKRKFEFNRFLKILKTFMKVEGSNDYIRIFPSPGFEKKVAGYPLLNKLCNYSEIKYLLLDKYLPRIKGNSADNLIYFVMRHSNPTTMGTAGDLSDLKIETVQFLLLHELCHNLSKENDVDATFDNPKDKRLMLAPVYYLDLMTGKINFNLGKISDESVREAYKSIIK